MTKGLPFQTFTTATQRNTKPANPNRLAPLILLPVINPIIVSRVVTAEGQFVASAPATREIARASRFSAPEIIQ